MTTKTEVKEEVVIQNPRAIPHYNALMQANYELQLARQVPEMRRQRTALQNKVYEEELILKIFDAGFEPFHVNSRWHTGYLERPARTTWGVSRIGEYKIYQHAMPQRIIDAYKKAKDLKLFNVFTIHSPDAGVFQTVTMKPIDPVLIDWINGRVGWSGAIEHGESFLIGQWDLAKDLTAVGLLLPEITITDPTPEAPRPSSFGR